MKIGKCSKTCIKCAQEICIFDETFWTTKSTEMIFQLIKKNNSRKTITQTIEMATFIITFLWKYRLIFFFKPKITIYIWHLIRQQNNIEGKSFKFYISQSIKTMMTTEFWTVQIWLTNWLWIPFIWWIPKFNWIQFTNLIWRFFLHKMTTSFGFQT